MGGIGTSQSLGLQPWKSKGWEFRNGPQSQLPGDSEAKPACWNQGRPSAQLQVCSQHFFSSSSPSTWYHYALEIYIWEWRPRSSDHASTITFCSEPLLWTLAALVSVNPSRLMGYLPLRRYVHLKRGTLEKLFAFIQMNSIMETLNAGDSSGDLFGRQAGPLKSHDVNGSSVTCKCDLLLHSEVLSTSPRHQRSTSALSLRAVLRPRASRNLSHSDCQKGQSESAEGEPWNVFL